jgi:uncharacterized spore protein YtfJ
MTAPETVTEAQQQVERSVAGPANELLEHLAAQLGTKASVSAVYGQPVDRENVTIIPVAKVSFGFGGGAGTGTKGSDTSNGGGGGGGGGGVQAVPLGYIEIKDGNAVFKPIRHPMMDVIVPLLVLAAGSTAPRILRAIRRLRRN